MHRLFVALRPPRAMRQQLLDLMGGVPGARWQSDDQLHLTLRFVGEVDRPQAEDIAAALGTVGQPRPTVSLKDIGSFDHKRHAHSLWVGIAADEALCRLRDLIDRALIRAAIPPDGRLFKPHITIARLPRRAGPIDAFVHRTAGLSSPPVTLDAFLLYESHLGREGAAYAPIALYPLI